MQWLFPRGWFGTSNAKLAQAGGPTAFMHRSVFVTVRGFALTVGVIYLAFGVLGFVPALITPPFADAPSVSVHAFHGDLLGLFPVNFMHNLVHLAVGAWGVAASRSSGGARAYSKTIAVFYGVLAVMGLLPTFDTLFGLVPLHGNDVWLHAMTASIAAYFGWHSRSRESPARQAAVH
jgi:hypothetical protein